MDKQHHLDQLFRLAQQDETVQSFGQTKDRFVSSVQSVSVKNTPAKQVFTKNRIIMLTTVSTIGLSFILLFGKGENKTTEPKTATKTMLETPLNEQHEAAQTNVQKSVPSNNFTKPAPFVTGLQELVSEIPLSNELKRAEPAEDQSHSLHPNPPKLWDESYQFPVLTEEEIAITKKKKKSMLKALAKHDKNAYAFIPSGSFDYNGKTVSTQAFYMGTTEVTNFEYRTFLFDLIIQGRKNEFLKAKPDQSAWNKEFKDGGKSWEEKYFSHPAFNDYPVVNISREGAELYCKWLSQEVRKYVGDNREANYNDVRLPVRAEWVKAASNEGKQLPYPWDGQYRRNSRGLFQANFTQDIVKDQIDTTRSRNADYNDPDVLAPSKSFWPNALGLYNMAGNAAEMVYEGMDKTEPGTAGGSWRSSGDDIKIYAPDPYKGVTEGKPTIGFRVVTTYLILDIKKVEYKE